MQPTSIVTWTKSKKWNNIVIKINEDYVVKRLGDNAPNFIETLINKIHVSLEKHGINIVKKIESKGSILLLLDNISPFDYGLLDRVVYSANKFFWKQLRGTISHKLTIFKANEPIPEELTINFLELVTTVNDRAERYKILNAFANYLSYEYNLLSAKIGSRYVGVISLGGESYSINSFDYEGKTYNFRFKKLVSVANETYWYNLFLQQFLDRHIRKTLINKGFSSASPYTFLDKQTQRIINNKFVMFRCVKFMSLILDNFFAISLRPCHKIFALDSLWDYFEGDLDSFLANKTKLIGNSAYSKTFYRLGSIIDFLVQQKSKSDNDTSTNEIPIAEIKKKYKEPIHLPISEFTVSFRFDQLPPNIRTLVRSNKHNLAQTESYFSKIIEAINPLELGNYTFTFSTKPLEVVL